MYYRFFTMFSYSFLCLFSITIYFPYSYLISLKIHDTHNIVFFKFSFNTCNTDRKNTDCIFRI